MCGGADGAALAGVEVALVTQYVPQGSLGKVVGWHRTAPSFPPAHAAWPTHIGSLARTGRPILRLRWTT